MRNNNLLRRVLSLVMVMILTIGIFPTCVFAEEAGDPHTHSYVEGVCECGATCPHTEYTDGKCSVCGMDEPHTHSYTDGICTCGATCPHTEYADGKCTVCGADEPHTHSYVEGVCSCGATCPHTEYADGKCTVCGADEPHIHSYVEGVCECGETCPHAEYADGKCTVCGVDEPSTEPDPVYGSTSFVYVGSNESVTGANLVFYITWGTATYNDYAANVGITVSTSGNTATLTVDKHTLADTTVWMNVWENSGWTTWNGVSTTFSGETYYLSDSGVSTTPPTNPDPEPHTHSYVEGVCECGEVCPHEEYADGKCTVCGMDEPSDAEYVTASFVYVGTNESITASNLVAYITNGTETLNANAEDCGFTVARSGDTLTLTIDKTKLTDAVWMKIWDNVVWTTWDSINPAFCGETYYLYDNGVVSTTAPTPEEPDETEYATVTFEYAGSNTSITGASLRFWVYSGLAAADAQEWGADSTACGVTAAADGKRVTLTVDKATLTDQPLKLKIWEEATGNYTTWDQVGCAFDGGIYYVYDNGVSTTAPTPEEPDETEYATVTFEYAGGNTSITGTSLKFWVYSGLTAADAQEWGADSSACGVTAAADGKRVTLTVDKATLTDQPLKLKIWEEATGNYATWDQVGCAFDGGIYYIYDNGTVSTTAPTPEEPDETEYATVTFEYAGSNASITGASLKFWVYSGLTAADAQEWGADSSACGITAAADGKRVTLTVDNATLTDQPLKLKIWEEATGNYVAWDQISCAFDDSTYYIYDDGVSSLPPNEYQGSEDEKNTYSFTVHCYGEGYQIGAWMALVEDGAETAWTASGEGIEKAFENPANGWTAAELTWNLEATYNRLSFQFGEGTPWGGTTYNYDFTGGTGEIWVVPGYTGVYTSEAEALAAMESDEDKEAEKKEYSFTVHCKGEGYQIGAWLAVVKNGTEIAWTESADAIISTFENPENGWTSVVLTWKLPEGYNRLGFTIGKNDPWASNPYSFDFEELPAEVWIVPGYSGAYSTKEAALANAWSYYYQFKVHCYGEGYQIGAWLAKVSNGEEVAWTPAASSVIRRFSNPQDSWTTATVSWSTKTLYNRLGFTIGIDDPWASSAYAYDFTERTGEIWILPDDPTVYLSEEAALEALNNPASGKYSFHVHVYGENYQVGAWLAMVQGTEEVAWTAAGQSVTKAFTAGENGWSDVWVKWNVPEDYNRLGFTIGIDDPWASETYNFDFKECPVEIWIVPGDLTIYLSQEEAEDAMTPGEEMTIPPETEPPATEAVEAVPKEESTAGSSVIGVVGICGGIAAAGGFLWWLIAFLRKRK